MQARECMDVGNILGRLIIRTTGKKSSEGPAFSQQILETKTDGNEGIAKKVRYIIIYIW